MRFRRAVERYGRTPEPETPYQRAGQLWDERIGSARVQARNWRLMALGSLLHSGLLAGGLLWLSAQSRVVPYVVEVDRLGEPRTVAPAAAGYSPTDPQIAWHLARFIEAVRSVSLDPVLMRRRWLEAYDQVTDKGAAFLGQHAREARPFEAAGRRTVSVQVTSVVRASDRSFQVQWVETAYEQGSRTGTSRWTAILTISIDSPRSAEALRRNPLGLFVDAVDWSRELEAEEEPGPAPAAPADLPLGHPLHPSPAFADTPAKE